MGNENAPENQPLVDILADSTAPVASRLFSARSASVQSTTAILGALLQSAADDTLPDVLLREIGRSIAISALELGVTDTIDNEYLRVFCGEASRGYDTEMAILLWNPS